MPRERFELAGLEAVATLVDQGLGVALVPDWAPPWPEGLSLAKLPVPDRSFVRRIGLIWTRDSVRVRLVRFGEWPNDGTASRDDADRRAQAPPCSCRTWPSCSQYMARTIFPPCRAAGTASPDHTDEVSGIPTAYGASARPSFPAGRGAAAPRLRRSMAGLRGLAFAACAA
jgi:hypothetical protein